MKRLQTYVRVRRDITTLLIRVSRVYLLPDMAVESRTPHDGDSTYLVAHAVLHERGDGFDRYQPC